METKFTNSVGFRDSKNFNDFLRWERSASNANKCLRKVNLYIMVQKGPTWVHMRNLSSIEKIKG